MEVDSASPPRARFLPYLDGIRGLTALYIVLYHCYFAEVSMPGHEKSLRIWERLPIHWLSFGEEAMDVFLVLSGYLLMAQSIAAGMRLDGGWRSFFIHRAQRVLPPYYGALALSLILIVSVPGMQRIDVDLFAGTQAPHFSKGMLASHLALVPHLRYEWKFGIDPPMWGGPAIWWNYFVFALVLLPLWKRIGGAALIGITFLVTLSPHFLKNVGDTFCPWYAGIMTLGMAAASVHFTAAGFRSRPRTAWLGVLAPIFLGIVAYVLMVNEDWFWKNVYLIDILVGCAAACFLVYMTETTGNGAFSVLAAKPLRRLGDISYALCLVHFPVLWLLHLHVTEHMNASPEWKMLALMALGVPASLLAAWGFQALLSMLPGQRVHTKIRN